MDEEITYLCKNINSLNPCINQYPYYLTQVGKEFEKQIKDDAQECFNSFKEDFTDMNYEVAAGPLTTTTKLKPSVIEIALESEVSLEKNGIPRTFNRFDTFIPTKLHDIAFVTNEILTQEAKYCYFSVEGFMALYTDFKITSFLLDDTTNIYTIKNKESQEELKMAVRGCAMPGGYF